MTIDLPGIGIGEITSFKQAANTIEKLVTIILRLRGQAEQLTKENNRLKKQSSPPGFTNNGKPRSFRKPSNYSVSKFFKDKFSKFSRKKNRKKAKKVEEIPIDQVKPLPEAEVCDCGCTNFTILRKREKTVQGIIIKRNNIKFTGNDRKCANCGKVYPVSIPEEIKCKQFDSNLTSWISLFKYDLRFTEGLIHNFLTGLGIRISTGQISKIISENGDKLTSSCIHLKIRGIKLSKALHTDATGIKRRLKLSNKVVSQHLHFVGNRLFSLFKITRKYNQALMAFKVPGKQALKKVITSDDHPANKIIALMQLCWLHEIRHYLKLTPVIRSHLKIPEQIITDWWLLYRLAKNYGRDPTAEKKQEILTKFRKLTNKVTGYEQLDKRLELTREKEERLLLFLDYPGIPIENNLAERDLRPAVVIRKISGMFKSEAGDRSFERHMSIIQTAKKQGLDVFQTLHGLLNNQISPFVLTVNI